MNLEIEELAAHMERLRQEAVRLEIELDQIAFDGINYDSDPRLAEVFLLKNMDVQLDDEDKSDKCKVIQGQIRVLFEEMNDISDTIYRIQAEAYGDQ